MAGLIDTAFMIGILLIIVSIVLICSIKSKDWFNVILGSIYVIVCIVIEIALILEIKNTPPEPTAIDVYRGLTELEITSVNGVPQDTIVVFKNR
jgi:hypothetical protein